MRNPFSGSIATLAVASVLVLVPAVVFLPAAPAQSPQPQTGNGPQRGNSPSIVERLSTENANSAPAPKHDISGFWAGPIDSTAHNVPPMTPLGEQRYKQNKPEPVFHLAGTNDPLKTCDPLGFPRNVLNETRGMGFFKAGDNLMVQLSQYERVWRDIWTDGRELPKNVDSKEGPASRYYGYSVGHWDGDYTFVVDTVGVDDRTWLDKAGHPHSVDMRVQERYTRVDHNTLHMSVTIDDPKIYTKPFEELTNVTFKWIPDQKLEEQLCVPSEGIAYMNIIGIPAGTGETNK